MGNKVRVLIVDDSSLVRKSLREGLDADAEIEVVGTARDPYVARDLLVKLRPDVITLDVEMPRMDGVTFLRKYMEVLPTPTVMISSLTESGRSITMDALEAGAVDIVSKPRIGLVEQFPEMMEEVCLRVKAAAQADMDHFKKVRDTQVERVSEPKKRTQALEESTDKVIAIGASTGGVEALARILPAFPAASPGIVIVQHMPEGFTTSFAERLNNISSLKVKEAESGDRIVPGQVLLAPGGKRHMEVRRTGGQYKVQLREGEKVTFNRPSVDVLFDSVAQQVGRNATAVLMTGMGRDGAKGLRAIRDAGGRTFAQNKATSVIYGMPQEAVSLGAAEKELALERIPEALIKAARA